METLFCKPASFSCGTMVWAWKHPLNSKPFPQFDFTNYLALTGRSSSIKPFLTRGLCQELLVVPNLNFQVLASVLPIVYLSCKRSRNLIHVTRRWSLFRSVFYFVDRFWLWCNFDRFWLGYFFPRIKILHPRIKTYVIDITHRYMTPPTHNGHLNGRPRNFGPVRFSLTMTFTMIIWYPLPVILIFHYEHRQVQLFLPHFSWHQDSGYTFIIEF